MNIRPLADRIVVKRLNPETVTSGGLFIPDGAQEKPTRGEVVAVGTGYCFPNGVIVPLSVKVGDSVLFKRNAGSAVQVEGQELLIMSEAEVHGVEE